MYIFIFLRDLQILLQVIDMIDSAGLNFIQSDRSYANWMAGRRSKLLRSAPLHLILRGIELGDLS